MRIAPQRSGSFAGRGHRFGSGRRRGARGRRGGAGAAETGRPAPLSRFFPRQDLVVYAEFDGLDAHRDGWRKTAAYRMLNETTTGAMLEQTLTRLLDDCS